MRYRSAAVTASIGLALALSACGKSKPAPANSLDAMDSELVNGAVTNENAQLAGAIKVDPAKTGRHAVSDAPAVAEATPKATVMTQGEGPADTAGIPGLVYAKAYAAKLPPELPIMPGATLQEAAGRDTLPVLLRVVSFTAPGDRAAVLNWYAAKAKAAGYSATRTDKGSDATLEGDRADGSAYSITAGATAAGRTPVDLVWSKS